MTYAKVHKNLERMFSRDPVHSVSSQISQMVWEHDYYKGIVDADYAARKMGANTAFQNGYFFQLILNSYLRSQSLFLRRLTELSSDNVDKKVISIPRLISEIRSVRADLTRKEYVEYHKPKETREYHDPTSDLHCCFDTLSGKDEKSRGDRDIISKKVLLRLDNALSSEEVQSIIRSGNKYAFHAADEHSRSLSSKNSFSMKEIQRAHEIVCAVAYDIGSLFRLPVPVTWDATAQSSLVEFLNSPIVPEIIMEDITSIWPTISDGPHREPHLHSLLRAKGVFAQGPQ